MSLRMSCKIEGGVGGYSTIYFCSVLYYQHLCSLPFDIWGYVEIKFADLILLTNSPCS